MRLIDVDAFKADYRMADECKDCKTPARACEYDRVYTKMDFCSWLDDAPTIEPERKAGKWMKLSNDTFHCRVCGKTFIVIQGQDHINFCPNCGADMRGKQK